MKQVKAWADDAMSLIEHHTRTDLRSYIGSGKWFAYSIIPTSLIAFLTALAFANLVPKETYGTYQYVLSVADLFGILVLGGIDSALARSVARGKDGSVFDALKSKIRWGLIGGAGAIAFGVYYFLRGNEVLGSAFVLAGVFIPFWEAPGMYASYLQGKKEFKYTNLYDFLSQLFVAIIVIAALYWSKNLLVILFVFMGGQGLARLFCFWMTLKKFPPNSEKDPELIPYGKHLTVMSAIANVAAQMDTVLLWQFLGPVAVAVYYFAQAIPSRASGLIKIINRIAFPEMANQDLAHIQRTLMRKVLILCGLAAIAALAYTMAAPYIFELFFPKYMDSVLYTQMFSLLIVLQPFSLLSSALSAQGKSKSLYIYTLVLPLIRVALFISLIPPFHLLGAAIALVLIKVVDSVLLTILFYRA